MEVRFAEPSYREQAIRLWTYCFSMSKETAEEIVNSIFKPDICLGAFIEGNMAACLYILPYEMFFYGNSVKMAGIGGVATLPEYRYHNCARNLLVKSLGIMKQNSQIFSALGPFSYAFYRKCGWELCYEYKEYKLNIDDFKRFGSGSGKYRPMEKTDMSAVMSLYSSYARRYNGMLNRSQAQWERYMPREGSNDRRYVFIDKNDNIQGYIFFRISDGKFHVNELIYSSPEVRNELFRFIYLHSAQTGEVVWRAPSDDNLILMLDNPRRDIKIVPGMMARIVDLQNVLLSYPFETEYPKSFVIKVDDPWAPWNDGCFEVSIDGSRVDVRKIQNSEWDLQCSIGTLTQIIMGYININQAVDTGKLQLTDHNVLKKLQDVFKPGVTFLNDSF